MENKVTIRELSSEFEECFMPDRTIAKREYDAIWEIYNSQPLMGGYLETTLSLIEKALQIVTDEALISWINDYKAAITA